MNEQVREAQAITDWLTDAALGDIDIESDFLRFCEQLVGAGIPVSRSHIAVRSLHPMYVTATVTWDREKTLDVAQIQPDDDNSAEWLESPLYALMMSGGLEARYQMERPGSWEKFAFLRQLQQRGVTDYAAQVVLFGTTEHARVRQDGCILTWATDQPGGFSDEHVRLLRRLGMRFGVLAKLDRRERTAQNIVSAYLGAEAGQRVLDGQIKLGDGEVISAVIWYSDLRQSTALAEALSANAFLGALRDYFQCTAGAVLDHGGEVLRFIGDAVLAIFHVDGVDGHARAAAVALRASSEAQRRLAVVNQARHKRGEPTLDFGLALHSGELMFGNIGVPERLEFSVVGPAANEVARLENLTKRLGRRVVVSNVFADLVPGNWESLGEQRVDGVDRPISVFAPPSEY